MNHLLLSAWLGATVLGLTGGAQAQVVDAAGSWPAAVDAAWQRARLQPERQAQLRRAEAELAAADRLWVAPPTLGLDHRSGRTPNNGSTRESEIGVSMPVWLPGQRQARVDAAAAGVASARRALEAARWSVALEVREAGSEVVGQQAEARQAQLQVRLMQALAEDVDRRVRAGDLARTDALAARAELLQAEVQQQDALQRSQGAQQRWRLLTGLEQVPDPAATGAGGATVDPPELAAAELAVEAARRRLQAVERTRRDPPEVGARLRRDTDNSGSANSIGVSLRIPLGTADRDVQLAQARSELEVAEAEVLRTRERLAQETQGARLRLQGAQRQLEAERARAGLLRQRAELIDASFRAGNTALGELLRALAAAAQADAAAIRQQAALTQAQVRLSQFLGVAP